jgi:hypothetical protein
MTDLTGEFCCCTYILVFELPFIVVVVVVVFVEQSFGESAVTVTLLWDVKSWNGGSTVDEEAEERTLARPLLD